MDRAGLIVLMLLVFLASCKENGKSRTKEAEKENVAVFPVTSFLKGQLKEIESSPVTLLKITEQNEKKDSVWLSRDSLRSFLEPFLQVQIDSASLSPYFTSSSFYEAEKDEFVLDYDAKENLPSDFLLEKITVYINAEDQTVATIYLVQSYRLNGGIMTRHLSWRSGKFCNINSIFQPERGDPVVQKEKMIWEF